MWLQSVRTATQDSLKLGYIRESGVDQNARAILKRWFGGQFIEMPGGNPPACGIVEAERLQQRQAAVVTRAQTFRAAVARAFLTEPPEQALVENQLH